MFDITNATTGDVFENQTVDQVVDYLNEQGALVEDESLREDYARVYENKEWLEPYRVDYVGGDDADEAFDELASML